MQLGSIGRLARLLLIATPPLLIGFLIFRDGVDTPFWDEWDGTAPLFEKMAAGTLGFTDFFAQHNEHRILFPRLIFFGLGRLTHWNIRAELFVSWFLALICLFNIWQLSLGIPDWIPSSTRRRHSVHLGCTLRAASSQFCVLNLPVHNLHVFDRERLNQLVTNHTPLDACTGAINIVQEMVEHLDSHVLLRTAGLFLGLRKAANSSVSVVAP